MKFGIVGAGISGAVIARSLAEAGHSVTVIEERDHVAGNCHTARDPETQIMLHVYGPHIFHTDRHEVWEYVSRFAEMMPFVNRVKAVSGGRVYTLPINLLTINQFFGMALSPHEAQQFIAEKARKDIGEPANFEEQALTLIGEDLYRAFFYGYTRKQWGIAPTELPASVLKRLPVRFNYDDNYFMHKYQGIPREGYTTLVERILDCEGVEVSLKTSFEQVGADGFEHVFYTGPIDRYFLRNMGKLAYRTLDFEKFYADGDFQGTAVMNYCDESVPYTRITEHKYFAPWESNRSGETVCYREFSRDCGESDIPYYPIRLVAERKVLGEYVSVARKCEGVSFVGRLGTYRYLDMDVTIAEALMAATLTLASLAERKPIPAFFVDPLA